MSNKLMTIIEQENPYSNLTRRQIDLYFYFKAIHEGKKWDQNTIDIKFNEDNSFTITNENISKLLGVVPRVVNRCLAALIKERIISVIYIPNKAGLIRKIYWKGLPNE